MAQKKSEAEQYKETLEYLYDWLPAYFRQGKSAIKVDLRNIQKLCEALGNPQDHMEFIHIAGTNGKGSVAHILSALLQKEGKKVGLYTSPHYIDFRERIKINGELCTKAFVIEFTEKNKDLFLEIRPSFFEVTVAMAFCYFLEKFVDVAIIETGLGGRLDSTNIIDSRLQVITSIGYDHHEFLGNTLESIASEKAGIIKENSTVILAESLPPEIQKIFVDKSNSLSSTVLRSSVVVSDSKIIKGQFQAEVKDLGKLNTNTDLNGRFQELNIQTALAAYMSYCKLKSDTFMIDTISKALSDVVGISGYFGRWQFLSRSPDVIIDGAHNEQAMSYVVDFLKKSNYRKIHLILGFSQGKEITEFLSQIPIVDRLVFTRASFERAMSQDELESYIPSDFQYFEWNSNVTKAYKKSLADLGSDDLLFVTGSIYLVGELLSTLE